MILHNEYNINKKSLGAIDKTNLEYKIQIRTEML
jgi:hypothetical protein